MPETDQKNMGNLLTYLGRDMGGAKRMGGGKRTRERALPKIFGPLQKSFWAALSWIFVQEKQSTDTWGGWKTYRTRGGPKPLLGGVSFVRFSYPLFFPPPHGVIWPMPGQPITVCAESIA